MRQLSFMLTNVGILITGPGVIMNAILGAFSQGKIKNANPKIVISSDKANAKVLKDASAKYGVKTAVIEYAGKRIPDDLFPDEVISNNEKISWKSNQHIQKELEDRWENYDKEIARVLQEHDVTPENGLVCLAEYRLLLSNKLVHLYKNRIMNIHPSLLPSFPGWRDTIKNTLDYGVKITGVTAHLVSDVLDAGPTIAQVPVPIFDDDDVGTLRKRMVVEACKLYPYCINLFASRRLVIEGDRTCGMEWKEGLKGDHDAWSYTNYLI